jgi:hypothetical protein
MNLKIQAEFGSYYEAENWIQLRIAGQAFPFVFDSLFGFT